ncbi:MAG TPA: hemerythrin domain-containing protein [Burkholderiaceae bacterium]|nr:hemerythrin domain-containing protein [Burkholderiaceae bacterium]
MTNNAVSKLSPNITTMIRMDHTHVVAVFHRFKTDTSPQKKLALVRNACLALEVHAQLEEEIFYPALRGAPGVDEQVLEKSKPEHDEMKRLIAQLRTMPPDDPAFDDTFMELIRDVLHHVADEETVLLPEAERVLGDRLGELGVQMTKRRLQLIAPHTGELALTTARSFPLVSVLVGAGTLLAAFMLARAIPRDPPRFTLVHD